MRKIIFSRKGFDSSAGGYPNLIFPDGTMYMIPIPDKNSNLYYNELSFTYENEPIQKILNDLTKQRIKIKGKTKHCNYEEKKFRCHLDPMEIDTSEFRGIAFGQTNASASHLSASHLLDKKNNGKNKVTKGDLFLFFSWFREVEKKNGKWYYKRKSPHLHVIFKTMIIEEIINFDEQDKTSVVEQYPFLEKAKHPHLELNKHPNVIFLSQKYWKLKFNSKVVLTKLDTDKIKRSVWQLPNFFNHPKAYSYIKDFKPSRNGKVTIQSPTVGQEFILDLEKVPSPDKEKIKEFIWNLLKH